MGTLSLSGCFYLVREFDSPGVTDTPVTRGFSTEMEKCLQGGERGDRMGCGEKDGAECTLVSTPGKTAGP